MALRPTDIPRWATGPTAQIAAPSEAEKDVGHVPQTVLTAQLANWLQHAVYQWLAYFDAGVHVESLGDSFALTDGELQLELAPDGGLAMLGGEGEPQLLGIQQLVYDEQHGDRGGGTQHAAATTTMEGFMTGPQVVKLAGIATGAAAVTSSAPTQITVTTAVSGSGTSAARSDHVHSVSTAAPTALAIGSAQNAGAATSLARSDHVHAMPAAAAGVGLTLATANAAGSAATFARSDHTHAITGVLTSTAPTQVTVTTAAVGVATDAARQDHVHSVSTAAPSTLAAGGTNTVGTATALARADHVHALPAYGSATATICQGDDGRLSNDRPALGIRTATTVVLTAAAAAPSPGQVLTATSSTAGGWATPLALTAGLPVDVQVQTASAGASTQAARQDHAHAVQTAAPVALTIGGVAAVGTATSLARSDHVHAMPNAGTPRAVTPGDAAAPGTGVAFAASDHTHGMAAFAAPVALAVGGANVAGAAGTFARSDHTHQLPAFGTTAGTFCEGSDARLTASAVNPAVNGFRIAPTSDDSTPADGTFSTIYLAPVESDQIALYTGSIWAIRSASGVSYVLSGHANGIPFDLFAWWDTSGTPAVKLEAVNWSLPSARVTGLTRVNGVWTKSGDPTRRYLGTVRPRSATTYRVLRAANFDSSSAGIDYWNLQNQREAAIQLTGSASDWFYTPQTIRQANGNANAQIECVAGIAGYNVVSTQVSAVGNTSNTSTTALSSPGVAVGVNSTTAASGFSTSSNISRISGAPFDWAAMNANLDDNTRLGVTSYVWLERGDVGVAFFGTGAGGGIFRPGMIARISY